jgi:dipeptidyl aminopeptidase/acylaminoacyl peptidase
MYKAAFILWASFVVATGGGAVAQPSAWHAAATTDVTSQSVTFSNGDARLQGTLYVPRSGHPVPALVVYHGASEPLASTPIYRHLSEGLPQIGVAVLLFDRRGTGASTGKPDVAYQVLSDDGVAGANAIRKLPMIDAARVGYWGISQGGWLATLAASHDPLAAFAIAVSAPLVSPELQMEFAMANRLHVLGYGQGDIDDMLAARRKLDGYFGGRNSRDAAVAALANIEKRPWYRQMYLPRPESITMDPAKSSWRGEMDIDSFAEVARVRIPMLFILGGEDPWIPVAPTVARLRELAPTHPPLQFAVVPRANHLMMEVAHERMDDADSDQIASEAPQSPAYFLLLGSWLEKTPVADALPEPPRGTERK